MKPKNADCIATQEIETPLGPMLAGATPDGICLLEFAAPGRLGPQLDALARLFRLPVRRAKHRHIDRLRRELDRYFTRRLERFTVPLVFPGTPFQVEVWKALLAIPYGETRSYEDVARAVGRPGAVRAVGTANGRNRIAVVIPCHRVINKSGALGGYGGGLGRKKRLLDLEGAPAAPPRTAPPKRQRVDGGRPRH